MKNSDKAQPVFSLDVVDAGRFKAFYGPGAKAGNGAMKQCAHVRIRLEMLYTFSHRLAKNETLPRAHPDPHGNNETGG